MAAKLIDVKKIEHLAKVLKALSDPTRLKIINLLSIRDMCVCDIMTALSLTQPTTSHHLNVLVIAGLAKVEREGKWMIYGLSSNKTLFFLKNLHTMMEN